MSIIQVPVTFDTANRKKDRSVGLRFTTNLEVPNEDFGLMDKLVLSDGWLIFSQNELSEADVPQGDAPLEVGQKKPSARLRNVLYRVWEQKTDKAEPFDASYYPRIMERIIERYKQELD